MSGTPIFDSLYPQLVKNLRDSRSALQAKHAEENAKKKIDYSVSPAAEDAPKPAPVKKTVKKPAAKKATPKPRTPKKSA